MPWGHESFFLLMNNAEKGGLPFSTPPPHPRSPESHTVFCFEERLPTPHIWKYGTRGRQMPHPCGLFHNSASLIVFQSSLLSEELLCEAASEQEKPDFPSASGQGPCPEPCHMYVTRQWLPGAVESRPCVLGLGRG